MPFLIAVVTLTILLQCRLQGTEAAALLQVPGTTQQDRVLLNPMGSPLPTKTPAEAPAAPSSAAALSSQILMPPGQAAARTSSKPPSQAPSSNSPPAPSPPAISSPSLPQPTLVLGKAAATPWPSKQPKPPPPPAATSVPTSVHSPPQALLTPVPTRPPKELPLLIKRPIPTPTATGAPLQTPAPSRLPQPSPTPQPTKPVRETPTPRATERPPVAPFKDTAPLAKRGRHLLAEVICCCHHVTIASKSSIRAELTPRHASLSAIWAIRIIEFKSCSVQNV